MLNSPWYVYCICVKVTCGIMLQRQIDQGEIQDRKTTISSLLSIRLNCELDKRLFNMEVHLKLDLLHELNLRQLEMPIDYILVHKIDFWYEYKFIFGLEPPLKLIQRGGGRAEPQ